MAFNPAYYMSIGVALPGFTPSLFRFQGLSVSIQTHVNRTLVRTVPTAKLRRAPTTRASVGTASTAKTARKVRRCIG